MRGAFYSLFFVFIAVSCNKKVLPKEPSGTPVFNFKGEVDGVPLNLEAGNANYYMYASHYRDTNAVYVFRGDLKKDNCDSTCDYAVAILINDKKMTHLSEPVLADDALRVGKYIFNDINLSPLYYNVSLKPVNTMDTGQTYKWSVTDALGKVSESNLYCSKFIWNAGQAYTVKFDYKTSSGCETSHNNVYSANSSFQTTVEATREPIEFAYSFTANASGQGPFSYEWDFGDGKATSTSTAAVPSHTFDGKFDGTYYTVRVRVTDADKRVCTSYYQINANPDKPCSANFLAEFTPIPNYKAYEAITVIVTKPGGEVYSTKNTVQNGQSYFEVLDVQEYQVNKEGHPTKLLKIKLNCLLRSGKKQMTVKNAEATFAMSYP